MQTFSSGYWAGTTRFTAPVAWTKTFAFNGSANHSYTDVRVNVCRH